MIDVSTCEISTTFENKSSASANYRLENHQEIFHAKTDVKTDAGFFYSKTDGKTDAGFFGACRPLTRKLANNNRAIIGLQPPLYQVLLVNIP